MIKYCYMYPGMVYCEEVYAYTMADARQKVRDWLDVKRLPNGIEFWKS